MQKYLKCMISTQWHRTLDNLIAEIPQMSEYIKFKFPNSITVITCDNFILPEN